MFAENRYLRPLPPIVIGLIIAVILLFIGSLIAGSSFSDALGSASSVTWLIIGAIVVYAAYVWAADRPLWMVGTREVVYMALGAALYGVLSWIFNTIPVPSITLISLRPTVIIPIFFGFAFGPAVGFFSGFVGNILGDALTGWGVFPVWDIGNGLMGLVPGLALAFKNKERSVNTLVWVAAALLVVATLLPVVNPEVVTDFSGNALPRTWFLVPLIGLVLLLVTYFVPNVWPWLASLLVVVLFVQSIINFVNEGYNTGALVLLILSVILGVLAFYLFRNRESISDALSDADTRAVVVWGTLGVIVGMGFAALADIFVNGISFFAAFVGEFIPAAGPNTLFAILLTPLLYGAWKQAQSRSGR